MAAKTYDLPSGRSLSVVERGDSYEISIDGSFCFAANGAELNEIIMILNYMECRWPDEDSPSESVDESEGGDTDMRASEDDVVPIESVSVTDRVTERKFYFPTPDGVFIEISGGFEIESGVFPGNLFELLVENAKNFAKEHSLNVIDLSAALSVKRNRRRD